MKNSLVGTLALVLAAMAVPSIADAEATTVNCNRGQKITTALDAGFNEIKVVGTCTENVEIRDDDVTIEGVGAAKVVGGLFVNGAQRVTIKNLTVEGGTPRPEGTSGVLVRSGASLEVVKVLSQNVTGEGVVIDRGASAILDQVTSQNNSGIGIYATGNSYLEVRNGSVVQNNGADGIVIELGSGGSIRDSTLHNNGDGAVTVLRGGSAVLVGNTIENDNGTPGVTVTDNGAAILTNNSITSNISPLLVRRSGTVRLRRGGNTLVSPPNEFAINMAQGTQLTQDRGHDTVIGLVGLFESDVATFSDVEIRGDVTVDRHSTLSFATGGSPANILVGNISVSQDSGLDFGGDQPIQVNGSIDCADNESSVTTPLPGNVTVVGTAACTGFD